MARVKIEADVEITYVLVLNLMRDRVENCTVCGHFESKEAALAFHDSELVTPYTEEGPSGGFDRNTQMFNKCFRKGGPLEWMNALGPDERETPGRHGHGVHEHIEGLQNYIIVHRY